MRNSMLTVGGCALASLMLVAAGCGKDDKYAEVPKGGKEVGEPAPGHEHGPHGGHLVKLEDGIQAEVVVDFETRQGTLYILDKDQKPHALPSDADVELHLTGTEEVELKGKAVPLATDGEGKSSRFEFEGKIPDSIKNEEQLAGHVHVTAGGKSMNGEISHDDHDHDH
ncbi:MAG: hypothetical protein WED34_13815 [Planctomycetales bacterium]